jgi:hypothetical protein
MEQHVNHSVSHIHAIVPNPTLELIVKYVKKEKKKFFIFQILKNFLIIRYECMFK